MLLWLPVCFQVEPPDHWLGTPGDHTGQLHGEEGGGGERKRERERERETEREREREREYLHSAIGQP